MLPLIRQIKESHKSYRRIADDVSRQIKSKINHKDVHNFVLHRFDKIGSAKKVIIRNYFRSIGWLPTPPPKERCTCTVCGKEHVKKKLFKSSAQEPERVSEH